MVVEWCVVVDGFWVLGFVELDGEFVLFDCYVGVFVGLFF